MLLACWNPPPQPQPPRTKTPSHTHPTTPATTTRRPARRQVLGVYEGRQWALIEEHLHDVLGKQCRCGMVFSPWGWRGVLGQCSV